MEAAVQNQAALKRLLQWMSESNIDACLLMNPVHIRYFTGFSCNPHERFAGLFVSREGAACLLVPQLELEKARKFGVPVVPCRDDESPYPLAASIIRGFGRGQKVPHFALAIEKEYMTVARFEAIQNVAEPLADSLAFPAVDRILESIRAVKSAQEIDKMHKAAQIVDQILSDIHQVLRVGATELEVAAWIDNRAKELGAEGMSFDTTVLSGAKSALPHGVPGEDPIQSGNFVLLDFGVVYEGYCSDITRTFFVGTATESQKRAYHAVKAANESVLSAIVPGVTAAYIDQAARDVLTQMGYGEYFIHRVGHGLGIEIHEFPSMDAKNHYVLQHGVTFTVEPGIYLPGNYGIRIEDDVVVTEDGVKVLTAFTKDLIEIQ